MHPLITERIGKALLQTGQRVGHALVHSPQTQLEVICGMLSGAQFLRVAALFQAQQRQRPVVAWRGHAEPLARHGVFVFAPAEANRCVGNRKRCGDFVHHIQRVEASFFDVKASMFARPREGAVEHLVDHEVFGNLLDGRSGQHRSARHPARDKRPRPS